MLTKLTPIFIIFIILFSIQTTADEEEPIKINDTPPPDWIMVKPGENTTISFDILLHKGRQTVYVPIPEIYSYFYPSPDTSYQIPTTNHTYQYLTCLTYPTQNLTFFTDTFILPLNITVLEKETTISIQYIFEPPKEKYHENTSFFIQNIEDISQLPLTEEEEDFLITIFPIVAILVTIPIAIALLISIVDMSPSSSRRRERERMRRSLRGQNISEVLDLTYDNYVQPRPTTPPPQSPSKTTFRSQNQKDTTIREFEEGDGLFKRGIKKFKTLPFDKQVEQINQLSEVLEFDQTTKKATINLNEAGSYIIQIKNHPKAYRIEENDKVSHRNPYIESDSNEVCLGSGKSLYDNCYANKNYLECIRVLCQILKSKDGKGFRQWSDCQL